MGIGNGAERTQWTLNRKIQILVSSVLMAVFAFSQFGMIGFISENVKTNFKTNTINTSKLLQNNIELIFDDASNSLDFLHAQYGGLERDDESIRRSLETLVEMKAHIFNSFIAYEDGSYELVPHTSLPDSFDPRDRSWYKNAIKSRDIKWSQPYLDMATGELVISGAQYIGFEDTEGVIGVDIKLSLLPEVINTIQISENGYFLLMNSSGYIISDSRGKYTGQKEEMLDDSEFSESKIITGTLTTSKGIYYIRRLAKTDIRLMAFLPTEDIENEIKSIRKGSSLFVVIALLLGLGVSYVLSNRLTKPIEQLTDIMAKSEEKEDMIPLDILSNDEIGTLINGYNSLALHVNRQNREMKTLSTELKESEMKLQEQYEKVSLMVFQDHLTNLPNRVKFEQHIQGLIEKSVPYALYYIDLDNFKYINDTYGHNYGDMILKAISERLEEKLDNHFFAARLSGDEFGVILSEDLNNHDIYVEARYILDLVSLPIVLDELEFSVTGSMGISVFPEDGSTFEELLSNADIAMYEAKNNLKNQYTMFNPELRKKLVNRVKIETNMVNGIENSEFFLNYQPLYDFDDGHIKGFEALVRWYSDELGIVYPDVFIPIAEHNLFINVLGYYVLERAVIFGKKLHDNFGRYFEMNVNVSTVQLHIEGFVEEVFEILDKHNYPYEYLNLEVTESVALETSTNVHKKLSKLKSRGIKISLDDFGTGYSSINHLLNLSLSHLKIDRSIILEATKKNEVFKLIRGIVDFAHAMELKVVAEGIEDEYMENLMKAMNVDFAQGYLYSRPLKEELIIELIEIERKND